eukprot:767747-Hanusia_phi.AAC.6
MFPSLTSCSPPLLPSSCYFPPSCPGNPIPACLSTPLSPYYTTPDPPQDHPSFLNAHFRTPTLALFIHRCIYLCDNPLHPRDNSAPHPLDESECYDTTTRVEEVKGPYPLVLSLTHYSKNGTCMGNTHPFSSLKLKSKGGVLTRLTIFVLQNGPENNPIVKSCKRPFNLNSPITGFDPPTLSLPRPPPGSGAK